jgi:hypothetical protein
MNIVSTVSLIFRDANLSAFAIMLDEIIGIS